MVKKRRKRHAIKKLPPGRAIGAEGYTQSARGTGTRTTYRPEHDDREDADLHGCQRLWRAVLVQAVQDAKSQRSKQEYGYIRHTAASWLVDNQADFAMVCDLAGLDASSTRRRILEAQGLDPRRSRPSRAELAILVDLFGMAPAPAPQRRKKAKRLSSYAARHVQLELTF